MGKAVSVIGTQSFGSCNNLNEILVDEENATFSNDDRGVLFDKQKNQLLQAPGGISDSYTIPDSVTIICERAFINCGNLTSVVVQSGVSTIEEDAFWGCTSLTNVEIPDSIYTISGGTFESCTNLSSVIFPDSVTTIGNSAFSDCDSLTEITIPDSVTSIGGWAFSDCDSLMGINIPANVTDIGQRAFISCDSMIGITVDPYNSNYCSDEQGVLYNKEKTQLIQAPGTIGGVYRIPEGVVIIGDCAFDDCDNLIKVMIPDSVTYIDGSAFEFCNSLTRIRFHGDVPSIESDAFYDVTATAYYPGDNATWTSDVMQDYGGTITWVGLGDLIGLEIVSAPTGGIVGEEPDLSGLVVELAYSNDARIPLDISELTISEIDTTTAGRKTVTVSYEELSAEFTYGVHDSAPGMVLDPSTYPESAHNYGDSLDDTQVFTYPGATGLILVFSEETYTETNYDRIYVYDESDNLVAEFTGNEASGVTVEVPGDTVKIRLTSDGSVNGYGYSFASISTKEIIRHLGTESTPGVEATCTEPGRTDGYFCEICEADIYEEIPALGHDYESVVTDPTPEANGYTTHTCVRCGDSYTDTITIYGAIANGICGEDLTWVLTEDGTLTISGEGAMTDYGFSEAPWYDYRDQIAVVEIGDSVTTIGSCAFYGYDSYGFDRLNSVTIGDSVTTIGEWAFADCDSLSSVTIPNSVTTIGHHAFYYCTSLSSVSIPDSVTFIGEWVFADCDSLSSVMIGDGVTTIGDRVFAYCNSLKGISVDENNPNYSSDSYGVLYDKEKTTLIQAPGAISGSYMIPDSVTTIDEYAFSSCTSLTSVVIGDNVTTIGHNAFEYCHSLTSVEIGNSVTTIGLDAFEYCHSLRAA